MSNRSAVISLL